MALFTKYILHNKTHNDGIRISVMSRHTLSDGETVDNRIASNKFDEHLPELAPSLKLVGDYYKRSLPWEQFEQRYIKEIRGPEKAKLVIYLANRALREDITILCIEDNPEYCHRRLLAEECLKYEPKLGVVHR